MTGRRVTWLVTLPLLAASSVAGHELGFWIAVPSAHERAHALAHSGHGWLEQLPLIAGMGAAFVLAALLLVFVSGIRGWRVAPPPLLFAVLPAAAFVVQEHVERALAHGGLELDVVTGPAFLAGLLLQLPFGLVALLLAETLAELVHGLGRALAAAPPSRVVSAVSLRLPTVTSLRLAPVLARGSSERGPPRVV
jgi:hypothetical protein